MARRTLSEATIETAIRLREEDELPLRVISQRIGCSRGALQWHFLRNGIDTPLRLRKSAHAENRPRQWSRHGRPVILFTPAEDRLIEALARDGMKNREIGQRLDPPRGAMTIVVRLLYLARRAARADGE